MSCARSVSSAFGSCRRPVTKEETVFLLPGCILVKANLLFAVSAGAHLLQKCLRPPLPITPHPPGWLLSACFSRPPVPQSRLRRAKYAVPHVGEKPPRDPLLSRRETLLRLGRLLLTKWGLRWEGFPIKRPSPLFILTYGAQWACVLFTETFITNLF